MSLYHRLNYLDASSRRKFLDEFDPCRDEEHLSIPSVIVVPTRPCRVTSSMSQHYRDMPGSGAEISPSLHCAEGRCSSKSKPWQVDMAKKSYTGTSRRRFKKSHRRQSAALPPALPVTPPPVSVVVCAEASALEGSWSNKDEDNGYPSDEENGFGGGCTSRSSSPASSTHTEGSSFGGVILKGYYGGTQLRRNRRV